MENNRFKKFAREHQIYFRKNILKYEDYNTYEQWLSNKNSIAGGNFFNGFDIFKIAQERYPIKNKTELARNEINVYSDMLRSEHMPLNLFVPFKHNREFFVQVLNKFMDGKIKSIGDTCLIDGEKNIKIEFAPKPKENYLNDGTSFDTYIEYVHQDGTIGIIGIETKNTEKEYPLTEKSVEENHKIKDASSTYYTISNKSRIYKVKEDMYSPDPEKNVLKEDVYRQIWRNQLLAESIVLKNKKQFSYATSILFYPSKNEHFQKVGNEYSKMLVKNENKFILIAYEEFIMYCYRYCPNEEYKKWIDYICDRYII
jgi:hypothetical protein